MANTFTFTADSITVKGKTFPAEYSVTPSGSVFVFVQEEGKTEKTRVRFNPDHAEYAAVLAAARNETPVVDPAPVIMIERKEDTSAAPLEVPAAAHSPAVEGKTARGAVPEKTFIGETITGNGWKIVFDGDAERTRVVFNGEPSAAARAVLEKARFFFSPSMNSWNKKLTFKAYRAAQALSREFSALYPAAVA